MTQWMEVRTSFETSEHIHPKTCRHIPAQQVFNDAALRTYQLAECTSWGSLWFSGCWCRHWTAKTVAISRCARVCYVSSDNGQRLCGAKRRRASLAPKQVVFFYSQSWKACRILHSFTHTRGGCKCMRRFMHSCAPPQNPRTNSLQLRKTMFTTTRQATLTEGFSYVKYLNLWALPVWAPPIPESSNGTCM